MSWSQWTGFGRLEAIFIAEQVVLTSHVASRNDLASQDYSELPSTNPKTWTAAVLVI